MLGYATRITVELLLVAVAGSIAVTLAASLAFMLARPKAAPRKRAFLESLKKLLPYAVVIGTIAFTTGYLAGSGRTPSVSELITASLALIGLLNIYVFGTATRFKAIVGYSAFVFSAMLLFGTQYGSFARELDKSQRLMELSEQELRVRAWRKTLNLPEDIPNWMGIGESH